MQRPDVRHDVAPGGDLDLHAEIIQQARHVGDGLLQRQVLAFDPGALPFWRLRHQQCLGVLVEVVDRLDLEARAGLDDLLHRATLDGTQDALAVLVGEVFRQLHLDLEDLVVAVLRVDDVVLRQTDVLGRDVPRHAVHLHEVRRAQRRRRQEVVERARRRPITLVADGLIGDDREVVEFRLEPQVVEKVDLDFHERCTAVKSVGASTPVRRLRDGRHYPDFGGLRRG